MIPRSIPSNVGVVPAGERVEKRRRNCICPRLWIRRRREIGAQHADAVGGQEGQRAAGGAGKRCFHPAVPAAAGRPRPCNPSHNRKQKIPPKIVGIIAELRFKRQAEQLVRLCCGDRIIKIICVRILLIFRKIEPRVGILVREERIVA